jgi:hypothetical protein
MLPIVLLEIRKPVIKDTSSIPTCGAAERNHVAESPFLLEALISNAESPLKYSCPTPQAPWQLRELA